MKKITLLSFIFIGMLSFVVIQNISASAKTTAATSSATITPDTQVTDQINNLKDKIASKVAQLKLVEKRGVIGTVTDVTDTQISLTDEQKNIQLVDVDELTKFASPSAKANFGISDITKGTTLGVLGLYNKDSHRILARFVDVLVSPDVLNGVVSNINKNDYSFTITTADNKETTIDVETFTKISSFSKGVGLIKSGFSKMEEGQRVNIVGFPNKKDATRLSASRIIIFPDLAINPSIQGVVTQQASVSATIAPTTNTKKAH